MANATKEMFKDRRKAIGMTQQGVATMMGVSLDSIKKWEVGARPIRPSMWALFELLSRDELSKCDE